ncbi:Xylose isomerase domain-containing protein TIM barrel [Planctomycetales bacterium 10988]|nr:Xylose isomerase domain-containing protein TIM barrel [Planctomycetales bacterium 10988]
MNSFPRRQFLQLSGVAALTGMAGSGWAEDRFKRNTSRICGLSMSSFSLKSQMKWWWGEKTEGKLDLMDFLDYCAELGLDAAELTSYFFPGQVTRRYLHQLKRRAYVLGLDISGGAMGNNFGHPPESDEAQEQMKYFQTWIDHFAEIGAPVVRVFATRGKFKGVTEEEILSNVMANLELALPYAEKRGVMLGLENHDFLQNVDYLVQIMKTIDSPWLNVMWDSANLKPTPDPYAELAKIAPYAVVAQVKVMTHVNGEPAPADFGRMIQILNDAHYRGYLVLEYEEKEDPYTAIPHFLNDVRTALEEPVA